MALQMWDGLWEDKIATARTVPQFNGLLKRIGGEGGIRTPDTLASMPHFECGAFNRSATSPQGASGLKKPKSVGPLSSQADQDTQERHAYDDYDDSAGRNQGPRRPPRTCRRT